MKLLRNKLTNTNLDIKSVKRSQRHRRNKQAKSKTVPWQRLIMPNAARRLNKMKLKGVTWFGEDGADWTQ